MVCVVPALAGISRSRRRRGADSPRQERGCGVEVLVVLTALLLSLTPGECKTRNVTNLQILDSLLKLYDRRATPTNHLNNATTVTCELYIRSFGSIDPNSMKLSMPIDSRKNQLSLIALLTSSEVLTANFMEFWSPQRCAFEVLVSENRDMENRGREGKQTHQKGETM
ncbi:uncharacterized protein LOC125038384 [Penaeus chinensis]|uniref:uncharacterized protein LOC125038384 n=1 Tax=Penaeus chinensis TaxID=139456 RepID=UPI001FB58112|nr:uncharacterized protein LOC125038384 [Penaeus chinensis]